MANNKLIVWCFLLYLFVSNSVQIVSVKPGNQDSLVLLQLIHTHGDRTPSQFVHNDPFSTMALFWPEGVGQLTKLGRNRLFKVGEFFKDFYKDFIGRYRFQTNIENFIKVHSSAYRRCLESAAALTTGLIGGSLTDYLHQNKSYETLSHYWTPIPVRSFYPKGFDPLLDVDFPCPNAEKALEEFCQRDPRIKHLEEENEKFLNEISFYAGETISSLKQINSLYQELFIESQYDYHWWRPPYQIWTEAYENYAIDRLRGLSEQYWTTFYDDKLIQRLIGGELIKEINNNIRRYINGSNQETGIFIYSTQDGKIVSILQAFGIYDKFLISPGSTLAFELHRNISATSKNSIKNYYVKFYYLNGTYTEVFPIQICGPSNGQSICHLKQYFYQTSKLESTNILYECGIERHHLGSMVNLTLLITNGILLTILILSVNIYVFYRFKKR